MGQKYICLIFMALFMGCFATSCKKKPSPTPSPTPGMSATVTGSAWSASTISKQVNTNGIDTITGLRASDSSTITLLFPTNSANPGDTLKIASVNAIEYIKSNITYIGTSGYIYISSNANGYLIGTFSATVEDFSTSNKITITGGSFTAKL